MRTDARWSSAARGRQECLPYLVRYPRFPRQIRFPRNSRKNFIVPGICARDNWAGGRLGSRLCLAYGGRGWEEKSFFAKRSHCKTSDIHLSYCNIKSYEIYRRSGIGFVIGFVLQRRPPESQIKPLIGGVGRLRAIGKQEISTGQGACTLEERQECLSLLQPTQRIQQCTKWSRYSS